MIHVEKMCGVMMNVFVVLSCTIMLLDCARADVCLACTDSPLTRECLYTMTCASHESCYADAFENPNGDILFNMGCRDRQLCGSFGKRGVVKRSNGNTLICAQCCFGSLCNAAICGQTGLPSIGPVCFNCDQAITPSSCNTIALCGRDDICYVEKIIGSLTHATLYKSGCLHKTQCERHAQSLSLIGRKRYDNTVMSGNNLQIQCCDSNLCNHGHTSSASGSVLATGTVAPTHSAHSTRCAYKVADGSFIGHGWYRYINGFATKTGDAQDGNHYISVTNGGAYQDIVFNGSPVTSFELSGWSRSHAASVSNPLDYSIYCDLINADGTETFGQATTFNSKITAWNKVVLRVHTTKVIRSARCYALFRNGSGSADFDNFQLESCA